MKPFYAAAAFEPRTIGTGNLGESNMQSMKDLAVGIETLTQRVQDEILRAQQRMLRETADITPTTFKVGDLVLLSTKNFAERNRNNGKKSGPRFAGLFRVTHVVNPTAVTLALPKVYKINHTINTMYL